MEDQLVCPQSPDPCGWVANILLLKLLYNEMNDSRGSPLLSVFPQKEDTQLTIDIPGPVENLRTLSALFSSFVIMSCFFHLSYHQIFPPNTGICSCVPECTQSNPIRSNPFYF